MSDSEAQREESESAQQPSETLNLRVVSQVYLFCLDLFQKDGNEVFFKIKKTTPLKKLTEAYLQRSGLSSESIRFLFDGNRINADQTPVQLGMEENDIIDAVLMQTGGM